MTKQEKQFKRRGRMWMYELFRRRVMVVLSLLIQVVLLVYTFFTTVTQFRIIYLASMALSLVAVLFIITRNKETAYKLSWVMLIAVMPAFGGLLFLIFHGQTSQKRFAQRMEQAGKRLSPYRSSCPEITAAYHAALHGESQRAHYLALHGYPICAAEETVFFPSGETMFERLCDELRRAEHFIFMEYFIIAEGEMWDTIHDILRERVAAGVEVRMIYDDMGCFFRLPYRYHLELQKEGIDCILFNPFRPVLSALQNNRDHRKITVIDGRVAFTGGINIGDEYINLRSRFGHWNDVSLMVTGDAVHSFTAIFLEMWLCNRPSEDSLDAYFPPHGKKMTDCSRGFVQPYADAPLDGESVGAWVYDHILRTASDYVWIATPYLIIDDALCTTLCLAAKSGVDVRIVTPGIPDKKLVYATTRSYYLPLLEAGVKIYEYTPGFLHAKVFLSDNRIATVGTINLDYRSLFLHFECGAWMTDTEAIPDIKHYFDGLFTVSRPVCAEDMRKNLPHRILGALMQLFAPYL